MAIVELLVKAGARVDSKDEIGGTPISNALCSGQGAVASRLMKRAQLDSVGEISRELLLSAAEKGHEAIVKRLLDNGVATEVVDSTGRTLLSYAAEGGHSPLLRAVENENRNVVELLLKYGARPDFHGHIPFTPLELAEMLRSYTIVQMLKSAVRSRKIIDINVADRCSVC
ncbi:hypothetical protein QQZ08_011009 [Neonectria magnoliae]|uniref:Ankyrin n=1 Tax=Neonectria magnoliae TaxID=2732573 RepID=A0ABR1HD72_9HYPO